MDKWIHFFILVCQGASLISSHPTTSPPELRTPLAKRFIPDSTACTTCDYFIGYYFYQGTWTPLDCNPGGTLSFTNGGTVAGCIATTATDVDVAAYCTSTSLMVVKPGITYTCSGAEPVCVTVLLFPNLDGGTPTTLIPCDSSFYTASMYRATTHAPATTSATATSGLEGGGAQSSQAASQSSVINGLTASSTSNLGMSETGGYSTTSSSTTSPNQGSSPSSGVGGSNKSNAVGLGVGIGLGVPAILIALAALLFPRYRRHQLEKGTKAYPAPDPPKPDVQIFNTAIPPGSHGNPAEMEHIQTPELDGVPRRAELGISY